MSTEYEFLEELPPGRGSGGRGNYDSQIIKFADALRANPGKWAKYPKPLTARAAYSYVSRINKPGTAANNMPTAFRSGEFEATVRTYVLYVRAKA